MFNTFGPSLPDMTNNFKLHETMTQKFQNGPCFFKFNRTEWGRGGEGGVWWAGVEAGGGGGDGS